MSSLEFPLCAWPVPSAVSVSREIVNPKDVIIAPVDGNGTVKNFCSQACLSSFDVKRNSSRATQSPADTAIKCSVCKKTAVINHEVNFQGAVHKLCSDACFTRFRSSNNLTMNCCETCATYCYSGVGHCQLLQIEGAVRKFCSPPCLAAYKQKSSRVVPAAESACAGEAAA
ncbi:zinc finger MYM-type protein 4-like [Anguilla rostrata]|uniref:zinc finger MYM-type protein 4-like n=1 Tax=Anguilla rostrata TaxID=7938 RepID=UPI0030CF0E02